MHHLPMNPNVQKKLAVAETFQKEETPVVHLLTPTWLHISAPARSGRLGRGERGEGPSVTLLAPPRGDISTRWLF